MNKDECSTVGELFHSLLRNFCRCKGQIARISSSTDSQTDMPLLGPTRWSIPPDPFLKANFDRALFHDLSCAGIGVVIRDAAGKVVGALSERINLPPTVEDVEALACKRAIAFAIELGLHHVVFEGDSATIIKYLQADTPCMASFGIVIANSLSLASQLDSVSFIHVRRMGNAVADRFAKLATRCDSLGTDPGFQAKGGRR